MSLWQAVFLGIIQGATEFLPVSSSGHLVLVPWLLRWESPGLAFDAVAHWGTALAVIVYFWREWIALARAALLSLQERWRRPDAAHKDHVSDEERGTQGSLIWLILLGTVPGVLLGYLLEDFFEGMFARPVAAAGFLFVTAALLAVSERLSGRTRDLTQLGWVDALVVGLGQALAILPGISRSGATISAGLALGMKRESAARFSFLLATPIVLGAGLLKVAELARAGLLAAQAPALVAGFGSAAAVGFVCIHFLLRYLRRRRLYLFAAYCTLLSIVSLTLLSVR